MALRIGILAYPGMNLLDVTGPYEVLARAPGAEVHLVWTNRHLVATELGLQLAATTAMDEVPRLDVLCVPGGPGVNQLLDNDRVLDFLAAHDDAKVVTSVGSGALALAAAGLLRGYRAATSWLSSDLLKIFGATPVADRVVVDRNRITGAGITAGVDIGLEVVATLCGERTAKELAILIEYDPAPAYSGNPNRALPDLVSRVAASRREIQDDRRRACAAAAGRRGFSVPR